MKLQSFIFLYCTHKDAKLTYCCFYIFFLNNNNNNNFIWNKGHKERNGIKENKKKPLHKAHNLTVFHLQNL
jgi:hypothetical protein